MPYYCTVPRCTSMAGKAKNVSFHQFPRDEELAKLWNEILKRGKPYTKYSKVCSLHFKPEDYTITSVGKNKGQWRTLRKDAIPSQNLPSDSPTTYQRSRSSGSWTSNSLQPNLIDPRVQQQMAQAIYMQTMLAMQATGADAVSTMSTENKQIHKESDPPENPNISEIERILLENKTQIVNRKLESKEHVNKVENDKTYQCEECWKCFKDPDVFVLHKRVHNKTENHEKENLNINKEKQETLKANPILANLLKCNVTQDNTNVFDTNNILSIENQIMTALAVNMESYIRNLSSMLNQNDRSNGSSDVRPDRSEGSSHSDQNETRPDRSELSCLSDQSEIKPKISEITKENIVKPNSLEESSYLNKNNEINPNSPDRSTNLNENEEFQSNSYKKSNKETNLIGDKQELNHSTDSSTLVIDENDDL